jgi:hypothetical protein
MLAEIRANDENVEVLWGTFISQTNVHQDEIEANHEKLIRVAALKASQDRLGSPAACQSRDDGDLPSKNWNKSGKSRHWDVIMSRRDESELPGHWRTDGDWHPAVGRRRVPKKQTQGDDGSLQKVAIASGWLNHRVIPALHKGCIQMGSGNTTSYGIRRWNRRHCMKPLDILMGWRSRSEH